jgi:hypothetical protein
MTENNQEERELLTLGMRVVQAKDLSKQRQGLLRRVYSEAGAQERLNAALRVAIKPTTKERLVLYCDDYDSGLLLIDEVVNEALHDYLIRRGW